MNKIIEKFEKLKNTRSDINEHLGTLKSYGEKCNHITEMGVRGAVSTWALLASQPYTMISYDINYCNAVDEIKKTSEENQIFFDFIKGDVLKVQIEETDLLFIDTLHTYLQLKQELKIHAPQVRKYIILHDTKTYGETDEQIYDHASDLTKKNDSNNKGLNAAIQNFLSTEEGGRWCVEKVFENNNGLTILKKDDEKVLKLDFLKRVLTDTVGDDELVKEFYNSGIFPDNKKMNEIIEKPIDSSRLNGTDWPSKAHTMIGIKRLNNLHYCLDQARINNLDGDLIETGVWRGGAVIFMKMYCKIYNLNKKVFVVDSFAGLPKPEIPEDDGDRHHTVDFLRVSLDDVKNNFQLYKALDEDVIFLKGWFADTLPNNEQIQTLCVLRMDGDMYKSTMDVFNSCYDKVVQKGFIIVDDYCLRGCKKATDDFIKNRSIESPLVTIDGCGRFWRKE